MNRVYGAVPAKRFCNQNPPETLFDMPRSGPRGTLLGFTLYPEVILLFLTADILARLGEPNCNQDMTFVHCCAFQNKIRPQ